MDFEDFWSLYPRKVAKKDADKAWKRLTPAEREKAVEAIPKHAAMWEDPSFIPYPATWLNGARWEDEIQHFGPTPKKVSSAWWTTHEGVERRARELSMTAKAGENWAQFKERVIAADQMNRTLRAV